jgi:ABC-2 type transport system permease protein
MWSLLKKELNTFFSSLTGYLVVIIFLVINSLFLWVIPTEFNILEYPYASLETLFTLSPWVFLFLVPATTMHLFSEERNTGTIELLLTKPISTTKIVLAKYFSAILLVLSALLPTVVYFITVYYYSNPVGNVDVGATIGSYIGLFFLSAIYCSIGIFASSISSNQIISFILATLLCFFFYMGFDFIGSIKIFSSFQLFIINLGINEHFLSMSRGVIDSRDLIYFIVVIIAFLKLTHICLKIKK